MEINLSGKKGRSTITNTIEVKDLKSEQNLQEAFLGYIDFLSALGAKFPDELLEILDEYDGSD